MRRVMTALGALLAAAPLALTAPSPATAATGTLTIEGDEVPRTRLVDPAPGCHALPWFSLMTRVTVINKTDADVIIYSGEGCKRGLLRGATLVRAGTLRERTLTGTYSLMVQPTT
ncbi:hypothetical protein [Sphaerisporangium perillae]|uniref:hypothetical protein n=1 Tax=Sphaerisporangium perillae TaxID=2935860 RepID=UPI00200D2232|nr:hypothetical protein [Sphaerisporangium perillae]